MGGVGIPGGRQATAARLRARPFARRRARRGEALRLTGLVGSIAVVVILACASLVLPPAGAVAVRPAARPLPLGATWIEIEHPLHLFALSGSPFSRLPAIYEARRRSAGVERQDILTFGSFGDGPYLRLAVSRVTGGAAPADLVVDYARIAATDGLALLRAGLPTTLPTRFGPVATADLALGQGKGTLPCLGFRLDDPAGTSAIAMLGVTCGTADHPVDRAALACALDRIDLIEAGDDARMRDFFVEAERRRGRSCGTLRPL